MPVASLPPRCAAKISSWVTGADVARSGTTVMVTGLPRAVLRWVAPGALLAAHRDRVSPWAAVPDGLSRAHGGVARRGPTRFGCRVRAHRNRPAPLPDPNIPHTVPQPDRGTVIGARRPTGHR